MEIKPCPCGETPTKLVIFTNGGYKYAQCYGDCCHEWSIEFRTVNYEPLSEDSYLSAVETWNRAPRK